MTENEINESGLEAGATGSSTVTRRDVLKRTTATMGVAATGLTVAEQVTAQTGGGILVGRCPRRRFFEVLSLLEEPREFECGGRRETFELCYRIRMVELLEDDEFCLGERRTLCVNSRLSVGSIYELEEREPCERDDAKQPREYCRVTYRPTGITFDDLPPCNPDQCVDFSGIAPNTSPNFPLNVGEFVFAPARPYSGFPISFVDMWPPNSSDGDSELLFPDTGIAIGVPETSKASATVAAFHPKPIAFEAYDADGNLLDRSETTGEERRLFRLSVSDSRITELVVEGAENEGILLEVCIGEEA